VALLLVALGGCGGGQVALHYPSESLVYPQYSGETPRLFVEYVNDLRPGSQRGGTGSLATVRFPSDEQWDAPVNQIYYQALVQDLTQTTLVEVVPLRAEADYTLEVDLLHLGGRLSRSVAGFAMAGLIGGGLGYAAGQSGAAAGAGALLGIGAIPMPTRMRAVCEVRLRIHDRDQNVFFEETCLGEVTKSVWEGLTSRKDQEWTDRHVAVAIKRCNACLLGQLRQALVSAGEPPP